MASNPPFTDGFYPEDPYLEHPIEAAFMVPGSDGFPSEDPFFAGFMGPGMPGSVPSRMDYPYASASFEVMRLKHDLHHRRMTECRHRNRIRRSMMDRRQQMAAMCPPMVPPEPVPMITSMGMNPPHVHDFASAPGPYTLRSPLTDSAAAPLTSTPDAFLSTPDKATSMPMDASQRQQDQKHQDNRKGKSDAKKVKKRTIEEVRYSSFPCNKFEAELRQAEMEAVNKTESLINELEQQAKEKNLSVLETTDKLAATKNYKEMNKNTPKNRNDRGGTIAVPKHCDVLLGRGASIDRHPGNKYFRRLIAEHKDEYTKTIKKMRKFMIATSIVKQIQILGGQFIEENPNTGLWHPVDDHTARGKAARGLRR